MTFFEQELRRIVQPIYPNASYIGRACYVKLGDLTRAKLELITGIIPSQYNAIRMSIINRGEGKVDGQTLYFNDLFGPKRTDSHSSPRGISPHIWESGNSIGWYVYHPTVEDYAALSDTVGAYLALFQEQDLDAQQHQTM